MIALVAFDKNLGIGLDNKIPWHVPADFKWFKEFTLNKTLLMGRKTVDGLPLLPNRYILTLSDKYSSRWMRFYDKKGNEYSKKYINEKELTNSYFDVICCGGAQIYKQFVPKCDEIYVTHINGEYEVDTFFPFTINQLQDMFGKIETVREFEDGHKVVRYYK
jgi:dihydrofolate reductase